MTVYTSDNGIVQAVEWLTDPANWAGADGVPARVAEHLQYSALILLIAAVIALPIGLAIGHTGRGRVAVVGASGLLRSLPTLGVLTLFALLGGLSLMPSVWALVLLAIPPLLAGAYSGVAAVERDVVDAARSMGMTEPQVLVRAELPNAMPVLLGGFRAAVLQVLATVTIVAITPLGGLGRYLIDGLAVSDFGQVFGGAIVIAALAILVDGLMALLQRVAVSPGISTGRPTPARTRTGGSHSRQQGGTT